MLAVFITITLIVVLVMLWIIFTRRRLMVLDGNVKDAGKQLEIQLSACLEARNSLLELDPYPELKENPAYAKAVDTVQAFENMARVSRLIYNDSVNKLNREIRTFPTALLAGILGFQEKEQLVEESIR